MRIDPNILAIAREMTPIRQAIHQYPETGFEEVRTSALVADLLESWGIETDRSLARTAVIGTLRGNRPGNRSVGLRADIDALDILERTGRPYESKISGKMHACGHDGHTAMLLGAAKYLAENRDFGGTIHFLFQPAEEGLAGARVMIEEGLVDRFPCDAVYGLHNKPGIPVDQFATRPGPLLAATDSWSVIFRGTGGHGGAGAHLATDPLMPMAQFVLGIQSIIGRNVPALDTAVLSVGHVNGGMASAGSVIPSEVLVVGTARSYKPAVRDTLERRLIELAECNAAAFGCTASVTYTRGYPSLVNHVDQTATAVAAARAVVGDERVNAMVDPITAGDDLAFMLLERPGAMMWLGNGSNPDGSVHNNHTPLYNFNDEALPYGIAYWISVARTELAA